LMKKMEFETIMRLQHVDSVLRLTNCETRQRVTDKEHYGVDRIIKQKMRLWRVHVTLDYPNIQ